MCMASPLWLTNSQRRPATRKGDDTPSSTGADDADALKVEMANLMEQNAGTSSRIHRTHGRRQAVMKEMGSQPGG